MTKKRHPKNLLEAVRYFSDLDVSTDFVASSAGHTARSVPGAVRRSLLL